MSIPTISLPTRANSSSPGYRMETNTPPTLNTAHETPENQSSPNQGSSLNISISTSDSGATGTSTPGTAEEDEDAAKEDEADKLALSKVIPEPVTPVRSTGENNLDEGQVEVKAIDDDTYDLECHECVSDSDADDSPEADLDIADDDDDYDAIDRLSDVSEHSDNIENDAENDIFAEGELGIDWNDEQTYGFDDSWQGSQYSYAAELQLGESLAEDTLLLLDQARRMSATKPPVDKPTLTHYMSGVSFPDEWSSSEDEAEPEPEKPVVKEEDLTRRDSQGTEASGQTNTDGLSVDGDDETDEEDVGFRIISSPSVTIMNRSPGLAQSSPLSRRVSPSCPRKASRKAPVMRKIPVDPKKAICSSSSTPEGRVIHFNVPKKSYAIRWIMAGNSRSNSTASCPSKFGFRSTIDHINSRTGSMIHDVINGRLFQQFHCSPLTAEEPSPSTEIVRNPFLGNSLRPMYLRTPSRRHGQFEELDMDFDEEAHVDALNLIDFDGGDADDDDAESEETADLACRAVRRHSAPAHSPNIVTKGENVNVPLLDLDALVGAEDDATIDELARPSRKRGYSNSSQTRDASSPILKRQRLLLDVPSEVIV